LLNLVIADEVTAFVTPEIIEEYENTVERLLQKYPDRFDLASLPLLWDHFTEVSHQTGISLARDADDDKFLACAMDSGASFIVSGDGDLLVIREINDIQIITVREFFEYS
jgi:putative PIN family toxin of toxin-antitoxin system